MFVGDQELVNVLGVEWSMSFADFGVVTLRLDDVDLEIDQDSSRWQRKGA